MSELFARSTIAEMRVENYIIANQIKKLAPDARYEAICDATKTDLSWKPA